MPIDFIIRILLRDVNGQRVWYEFDTEAEAYQFAGTICDEDEILIVAQGPMCLYSQLMAQHPLTAEDLTGFFG